MHWINPAGKRKVHSLVDKVYKRKNLDVAWEKLKRNRGAGGADGEDLAAREASLEANLDRLHQGLRDGTDVPQPVLQHLIPKAGQPGKFRRLGIPTVHDRVCQQALLNRLEPTFDPMFEAASCGYRPERSTHDALRKIWGELQEGYEWVVDADLRDFVGSDAGGEREGLAIGGAAVRVRDTGAGRQIAALDRRLPGHRRGRARRG